MASQERFPTENGTEIGWSPQPPENLNWQNVDDYDDTYDYNFINDPYFYHNDSFLFQDFSVPAGASIDYVTVYMSGKADPGGEMGALIRLNSGFIDVQLDPNWLNDWAMHSFFWPLNPYTGQPWTVDEVNGQGTYGLAEFGYRGGNADVTFYVAGVWIEVTYSVLSLSQSAFRFFKDDGGENQSTPAANENAGIIYPKNQNLRLRLQINASGNPPSQQYQLEYRISGGSWKKVTPL